MFAKLARSALVIAALGVAGCTESSVQDFAPQHANKQLPAKIVAEMRAKELRAEGLSLRAIGERLLKEGLYPPRGDQWYAATVAELLSAKGVEEAARRARELRAEGHSLREVGRRLLYEGYLPRRGALWPSTAINDLIADHSF